MYVKPEFHDIFLNLTDACNLRCRYCFVEKHPHYMELQTAKDTIDLLMDINKNNPEPCNVQLFGGEPTLMWDKIIVPLIEYCKEKDYLNKRVKFGLTSNCILLDTPKMDWMLENGITLLFSIDGKKETQDYNRPLAVPGSSFDILEPKIMEISQKFHPTFRGTLLPETCDKLFENIMYATQFEFANCFFIPDWSNTGWTQEKLDVIASEVRKYSLYFIDCYRQGLSPFELNSYTRMFSHQYKLKEYMLNGKLPDRPCTFCGLGLRSAGIGWDGKIFACQELPSHETRGNIYYIGDIYRGIDVEKREQLLELYRNNIPTCEDPDYCKDCLMRSICINNTCHASCFMRCGDMNCRSKVECFWDKLTLNETRFVSNVLVANGNEAFMNKYNIKEII